MKVTEVDCRDLIFVRCVDCLAAMQTVEIPTECACGGHVEFIGRVRDHAVYSDRLACDARCQNATGPNCECTCMGRNHGRHVIVEVCDGKVVESPVTAGKMAQGVAWRVAVREVLDARPPAWLTAGWLPRAEWLAQVDFSRALNHARRARTMKTRMTRLAEAAAIVKEFQR